MNNSYSNDFAAEDIFQKNDATCGCTKDGSAQAQGSVASCGDVHKTFTIAFLGDSITAGAGASCEENRYSTRLCKMIGAVEQNYGVGGTRIAKQNAPSECPQFDEDFLTRFEQMKDADFVFVFGGTNDYGHGDADFGDENSCDEHTFCGAVRTLASKLFAKYGKDNVCFILPLRRFDEDNPCGEFGQQSKIRPSLKQYVAAEEKIVESFGIDCLNLRDVMPVPHTNEPSEFYVDGLHPTDKGHALLAEYVAKYISTKRTCLSATRK